VSTLAAEDKTQGLGTRAVDPPGKAVEYKHNVVIIALVMIGNFEYLVLSAAARLGADAYGASVMKEIAEATGRACSMGALYTTLDRLQQKGLISTSMGDPTPVRGGRPKRLIRVTGKGRREAAAFYEIVSRVSRGGLWAT
jgi:DNA-binding PadR family transcriptional regulator